jgi:hypothetical protein
MQGVKALMDELEQRSPRVLSAEYLGAGESFHELGLG